MTTLNDLAEEIHEISIDKGFWPEAGNRNVGEVLMLIVSEASEALEAFRDGMPLDEMLFEDNGGPVRKPVGVPSELADVVIRVLDACAAWGVDIDRAVAEKIEYNRSRPVLHGRAR